jgi:hypothetical protein
MKFLTFKSINSVSKIWKSPQQVTNNKHVVFTDKNSSSECSDVTKSNVGSTGSNPSPQESVHNTVPADSPTKTRKRNTFNPVMRQYYSQPAPPSNTPKILSKAATCVKAFLDSQNSGVRQTLLAVAAPGCLFRFEGAEFLLETWIEDSIKINSSFPDFHLYHEKIVDVSPTQAMIVNLQATGTHTGAPYGFGPYPEISATVIYCKNDYEDVTVTIDAETGMIVCMTVVAKGPSSGPPGFYDQIGGIF